MSGKFNVESSKVGLVGYSVDRMAKEELDAAAGEGELRTDGMLPLS